LSCRRSRGHGTPGGKIVGIASEIAPPATLGAGEFRACDDCGASDYSAASAKQAADDEHKGERENSMNGRFALALSGLLFAVVPAAAQDWPTKTVRIIVPFGPGSTPDMVGRLIADHMQQKLGQPFVIENRPGASANTGTEMVAKADPDGYTIGVSLGGPLAINTLLFAKLPYDPAKDLALITMLTTQPSALVVHTSLGVNSVAELVDLLRRNPGKYNYGSIGNGSLSHLAMEALALKSGTTMVHVPYPGSPQAMTAVLRNDVQMACLPAISVTPHVASGQVKILAISLGRRSTLMPGVPTLKESGIDVEADAWNGLIAPAKTPDAVIAKIHGVVVDALAEPTIREKLATQLMEPIPTTPAQFRAKIDADLARWSPIIKALNLRIN
jgi:tripartite-type tricarboxylate transporter receptor subunit TctC